MEQLQERDIRAYLSHVYMGDYVRQELDRLFAKGFDIVAAKDGNEILVYGIDMKENEIIAERRDKFLIEALAKIVLDLSIKPLRAEEI